MPHAALPLPCPFLCPPAGLAISGAASPAASGPMLNFQAPPSGSLPQHPPVEVFASFPQVSGLWEGQGGEHVEVIVVCKGWLHEWVPPVRAQHK
jgi:hypothetical protein